jgi:hypothetical protein
MKPGDPQLYPVSPGLLDDIRTALRQLDGLLCGLEGSYVDPETVLAGLLLLQQGCRVQAVPAAFMESGNDDAIGRDVDVIIFNQELTVALMERPNGTQGTFTRQGLAVSWAALSQEDQFILRHLYALSPLVRLSQKEIARVMGMQSSALQNRQRVSLIKLRNLIWLDDVFTGLDPTIVNVLRRNGIHSPLELARRIDALVEEEAISRSQFQALEDWCRGQRLASLIPRLASTRRQQLRLSDE